MLTLSKTTTEHIAAFHPLDMQRDEFIALCEHHFGGGANDYCILSNGVPVLLVGAKEKWHKVFDTYTVFSVAWKPMHYRYAVRAAKSYFAKLDYDRIEHMCRCDRTWTGKMAEMFGFKKGAILRRYVNGEDYQMYEIVRD